MRASRGNFALVWVQSKGLGLPAYAGWTIRSSNAWAGFAAELKEETGLDVASSGRAASISRCRRRELRGARRHAEAPAQPARHRRLQDRDPRPRRRSRRCCPTSGPRWSGGSYCPLDGHVNSLRLFRALHTAHQRARRALPAEPSRRDDHAATAASSGSPRRTARSRAGKVVLAAGNANMRLAPMVGLDAPMRPERGQIIVTERAAAVPAPSRRHRAPDRRGHGDDRRQPRKSAPTRPADACGVSATMAERAVRMFPLLASVNVVRTWSGIRVMTQDGFPDLRPVGDPSRRLRRLLPFRRDARGQPRARRIAPMIARGALDTVAGRSLQRAEVPCSSRLPDAGHGRRLHDRRQARRRAGSGDTVAAALLAAGIDHCRTTPVSGAPRAPYCMMGVCFDCLVTIDGVGNRQGCLVPVREGMEVETQQRQAGGRHDDAARRAATDLRPRRHRRRAGRSCRGALAARAGLADRAVRREPGVGGQIYRAITSTPVTRPRDPGRGLLGAARRSCQRGQGERRADRQRRHGLEPRPRPRGRRLDRRQRAPDRRRSRVILATGALERPFPIPGWTLAGRDDGRRGADAAEGARAWCPTAARSWPARARCCGCSRRRSCAPAARSTRSSTRRRARNYLRALPHLPGFVLSPYLAKGLALLREVQAQGAGHRRRHERRGRRATDKLARGRCRDAAARAAPGPTSCCCTRAWCRTSISPWPPASAHRWDERQLCWSARARRRLRQHVGARHRRRGRRRRHRRRARRPPSAAASPRIAAVRALEPDAPPCPIRRCVRQRLQREEMRPRLPRHALPAGRRRSACPRATPSSAAARRSRPARSATRSRSAARAPTR